MFVSLWSHCPGERERRTTAKVIRHIPTHYEVQNVEMGKVYRRCPESVIIECDYDETLILTASRTTCGRCGADHAAIAEEVLDPRSEDKVDHPWRSLRPYYVPTRGTRGAAQEMRRAMPSGRRRCLKERGTSPRVIACHHDYPMLATPTETGRYYARCLACLTVGPERPSSNTAPKALRVLGAVDSSGSAQRRTPSARA
jgi:hypothetical protein